MKARTAAGAPPLSVFANDTAGIEPGTSRLAVRHTAAAPAVDVALVKRRYGFPTLAGLVEDLTNPDADVVDVSAGKYDGYVLPAGKCKPIVGPGQVRPRGVRVHRGLRGRLARRRFLYAPCADDRRRAGDGDRPGLDRARRSRVPVDVYVNGTLTLASFQPGTVIDPLSLPAGDYDIDVVPAGGDPAAPAIEGKAIVAGGDDATIVAHLTEAGGLTLSVLANDLGDLASWHVLAGRYRARVRLPAQRTPCSARCRSRSRVQQALTVDRSGAVRRRSESGTWTDPCCTSAYTTRYAPERSFKRGS